MSLYGNYTIKEKTLNIKIPIEIDDDLRQFIFKNINEFRDIKNDFISDANKYKKINGTYSGYMPLSFKVNYFKKEATTDRYTKHCVGLSEQVSKDINQALKSIRTMYDKEVFKESNKPDNEKKAKEGSLHFCKFDKFYGSFKVHNKPKLQKSGKGKKLTSRLKVIDAYTVAFRVRGNKKRNGGKEEIRFITLKEPLYDDVEFNDNGNHTYFKYYTEGECRHEYRFDAIDIKETCFIHELGKFYIQHSITVLYYIDNNEVDSRLNKAGIDIGIHNPAILYNGTSYQRIAMDDKICEKIKYLKTRAKRIKHHMDNKYFINIQKVENDEMSTPFSKNYLKLRRKFKKIWKHIRCIRRNWAYNKSKEIVTTYKCIVVDGFSQPINKYKHMNKKIKKRINSDNRFNAMCNFNYILKHMADKYGCIYIEAPRFTTRTCSCCGYVNEHLPLSERDLVCINCGEVIDRDMNAAKNCYMYI